MPKTQDKPETLRIVSTEGGYAVFIFPSSQPAAVFTRGFDLLDWVAGHVADWETQRAVALPVEIAAAEPGGDAGLDAVPADA